MGFEKRAARLPLQCRLAPQERDQLLGLAVREQERVVRRLDTAVLAPSPRAPVTLHDAGLALDLDQVEALGRQDEQIDLVDRPVIGDELEVRPGPVGFVIRQPLAHERQRLPLPRELGFRDCLPARRGHVHGAARGILQAIRTRWTKTQDPGGPLRAASTPPIRVCAVKWQRRCRAHSAAQVESTGVRAVLSLSDG